MDKRINKRIYLYIFGMAVFVVWLIFGTSIIAGIYNRFRLQEINFEDYRKLLYKAPVYASVYQGDTNDFILYEGGSLEKLYVNGWALAETEVDNSGRKVALILDGENADYAMFPSIALRDDVPGRLSDTLKRKMNIPSKYVGYSDEFSTLCIDDGIYDLYVYCWENDTNYGMTDTVYQIEKRNNDLQVKKWQSERAEELLNATQQETTLGNLDNITIDSNNLIDLLGWEVVEGHNEKDLSIIEFTDLYGHKAQYIARNRVRKDVGTYYDNNGYMDSGWRVTIPGDDLNDSIYRVRVLSKTGEDIWPSKWYAIWKKGSDVSIIWTSQNMSTIIKENHSEAAMCSFDSLKINDRDLISLWGWSFVKGKDSNNQKVYIEFANANGKTRQYTTSSIKREDVSEYYGSSLYTQSGWNGMIPAAELEDGIYRLRILIKNGEDVWATKPCGVEKNSTVIRTVWLSEELSEELSEVVEAKHAEEITGSIDGMTTGDNGLISLWGWGFSENQDCGSQTVYIEFTDQENHIKQYTTNKMVREDVAEYYGNLLYEQSGWNAVIPTAELKDGIYRLRIIVKNEDDVRASKPCVVEKDPAGIKTIWLSEEKSEVVKATRSEKITGSFDGITANDNGLISLWGWGFSENQDCGSQTVYIEFTDQENHIKQYTTNKMVREDVAEYYGNLLYEQSGWNAVIPTVELIDGSYTVRIVIENGEDVWKSEPLDIEKLDDDIIIH